MCEMCENPRDEWNWMCHRLFVAYCRFVARTLCIGYWIRKWSLSTDMQNSSARTIGIYLHWVKAISNIRIIDYFGYFLEMWWTIRNAVSNNELCYCFANDSIWIWILNQLLWLFVFANHYFSADRLAVEGLPAKEDATCGDCDEVYSMD